MAQHSSRARTAWLVGALDQTGSALILQLLFVALAWPLVTAFAAAVALQRQLPQVPEGGRPHAARDFWGDLVRTLRHAWVLCLGLPIVAGMAVLAVLFWAAAGGRAAILALSAMAPVLGLAVAGYLALLEIAAEGPDHTWVQWCRAVPGRVASAPLRAAGTVVVMLTCVLLLLRLPTLLLVVGGLLPAGLSRWAFASGAGPTQEKGQ